MKGYKIIRVREDFFEILKAYARKTGRNDYHVADEIVEIGLIAKRLLPPKSEQERAA